MNLSDLVPNNVRGFAEELTKLEISEIEVPKFYIPNWPVDNLNRIQALLLFQ